MGFKPPTGVHCESTTCGNLLASEGLNLSESLVFGLGSWIGFNYLERCDRRTGLRDPLVLCASKPDNITRNLSEVLGMKLVLEETVSRNQARANLLRRLDQGKPYGLELDSFYLDCIDRKTHFNAHYLTACGYDELYLYVVDVGGHEMRKTALKGVEQAKSTRGFMASKNLGFYYDSEPQPNIEKALKEAFQKSAKEMLHSGSTFSGVRGIKKVAERLCSWRRNPNFKYKLLNHYLAWEGPSKAGGGYRRLYAKFLEEASTILRNDEVRSVGELYGDIARRWSEIAESLRRLSSEQDVSPSSLLGVAKSIRQLSDMEGEVFRRIERAATC